jgi:hypothetical protein
VAFLTSFERAHVRHLSEVVVRSLQSADEDPKESSMPIDNVFADLVSWAIYIVGSVALGAVLFSDRFIRREAPAGVVAYGWLISIGGIVAAVLTELYPAAVGLSLGLVAYLVALSKIDVSKSRSNIATR